MTVIATMISRCGTAHATDSLLTTRGPQGERLPVESTETKVIPVRQCRGALAYWGFAGTSTRARTIDWLRERVTESKDARSPEEFARWLAGQLQHWLVAEGVATDPRYGIGIHFTAYERVQDDWIPELFLVSNFDDPSYASLRADGVGWSRETFSTITGIPRSEADRDPARRGIVKAFLAAGRWLRFNNGDPTLFNPTAGAISLMLDVARGRGALAEIDVHRLRAWTKLPVETVSTLQQKFYRVGVRVVGGRIHDLVVTPEGEYSSDSGDDA